MRDRGRLAVAAEERGTRRLYVWLDRRSVQVDAVVAVVCALLIGLLYLLSATGPVGWWVAVLQVALVLPLAWRRSRPFWAACVMAVPCLVQVVFQFQLGPGQVAVLVVIGANAARAPRWAARAVLAAGLTGIVLLALRYSDTGDSGSGFAPVVFLLVSGWAVVGVAWLIGDVARSRRLEREALADRAVRVERERAADRELAAAEERRHIAPELQHDIVAHSLAVVVTQADGARYAAAGTPGPALPALEAIAATARTALDDMRGLLGVLRDGSTARVVPAEGLDDLPAVLGAVRRAGLDVRFRVEGVPRHIGAGAELVLHRVVQEALTNVLKHGGSTATADVLLQWDATLVRVEVLDTGVGPDGSEAPAGGHGVIGMQERLAVFGGRFDFGPGRAAGRVSSQSSPTRGHLMHEDRPAIRVAIADDQTLVRQGLAMLVGSQPDLEVVAQTADGGELLAVLTRVAADVVLMDVRMPGVDGLTATARLLERPQAPHVVMLTTFDLDEYVLDAVRAGASGFLLKDAHPDVLLEAIRTVHRGDAVISPAMTRRLLEHARPLLQHHGDPEPDTGPDPRVTALTEREREVFALVAEAASNAEIAQQLHLSEATVKTHVAHLLQKLHARDRVQAVVIAYETGFVTR